MKSAGTEQSKNKYTLKTNIDTFNQFVCFTFVLFKRLFNVLIVLIATKNIMFSYYYCFLKCDNLYIKTTYYKMLCSVSLFDILL